MKMKTKISKFKINNNYKTVQNKNIKKKIK